MINLSDKKIFIFGLLVACPLGKAMYDCPLEKYRNVSNKERLNYLERFSDEEQDKILQHHHQCLLRRYS